MGIGSWLLSDEDASEEARERRAMIGCTFMGACILFAPGEFKSGGALMVLTLLLLVRHRALSVNAKPKPVAATPAESFQKVSGEGPPPDA